MQLTKKESARRLHVSRPTLDAMILRGELTEPLDEAAVDALVAARMKPQTDSLPIAAAAARLGVSKRAVYAMIERGELAEPLDEAAVNTLVAKRALDRSTKIPVAEAAARLGMTRRQFQHQGIPATVAAVETILTKREQQRIERDAAAQEQAKLDAAEQRLRQVIADTPWRSRYTDYAIPGDAEDLRKLEVVWQESRDAHKSKVDEAAALLAAITSNEHAANIVRDGMTAVDEQEACFEANRAAEREAHKVRLHRQEVRNQRCKV
jgi:hypothetical protein